MKDGRLIGITIQVSNWTDENLDSEIPCSDQANSVLVDYSWFKNISLLSPYPDYVRSSILDTYHHMENLRILDTVPDLEEIALAVIGSDDNYCFGVDLFTIINDMSCHLGLNIENPMFEKLHLVPFLKDETSSETQCPRYSSISFSPTSNSRLYSLNHLSNNQWLGRWQVRCGPISIPKKYFIPDALYNFEFRSGEQIIEFQLRPREHVRQLILNLDNHHII